MPLMKEEPKWVNDYNSYKPMKSLLKFSDDVNREEYVFHIDYKTQFIGEIMVRLQTGTKFWWDDKIFKITYPDGTKWTINYSWFL